MPRIPTKSPATGAPLPPHYIHTLNSHFVDQSSRVRILRGVNLCGSSKSPVGKPSWILEGFWEAVEAADGDSFVGRPLQLSKEEYDSMNLGEGNAQLADDDMDDGGYVGGQRFELFSDSGEADIHLARLRGWGFTLLRFVFTWEALEHAGPKKYDEDFISHLILVLQKCKAHGFLVFLDPHQDVWSRFTGGSGAPYWTLLACGINPRSLTATQAALIHNEYPTPAQPDPANFPAMIWGTNYSRLASQTLFTLFFAGRDFAPKCIIDGVNIQDYLQSHFIGAVSHLARRIKEAGGLLDECVLGWDSMNEPFEGMVGYEDLRRIGASQALKKGSCPTPAQGMRLGMGMKQDDIEWWDFGSFGPRRNGSVDIDPNGVRLWVDPEVADEIDGVNGRWGWKRSKEWELGKCIWALHGVWDPSKSTPNGVSRLSSTAGATEVKDIDILIPDYFLYSPSSEGMGDVPGGKDKVAFVEDYLLPHMRDYFSALRAHHPELIPFIQPPVFHPPPLLAGLEPDDPCLDVLKGRGCYSTHYYDGLTLMTRHWNWFNADALGVLRGKYSSPVFAVKIGEAAIRKSLREQLGVLKDDAKRLGEFPTVIGEIGTPMELDEKYSYGGRDGRGKGKGDYREQVKALDASLYALDGANTLSVTIWTYCTDSSHKWGDGWNGEDLSLWSADDERTSGSITGLRKDIRRSRASRLMSPLREEKDRAHATVQEVTDEDSSSQRGATPSDIPSLSNPNFVSRSTAVNTEELVGYQVSSATLTLDDLVYVKRSAQSLSTSLTLTNATSSRATLLPAYTSAIKPSQSISTITNTQSFPSLSFPAFSSAPMAFAFLTNGARAWKAFVRAYPLAIVGLPKGWEWDCNKAVFEMTVRVGSGDRSSSSPASSADGTNVSGFSEQGVATEIFLPLLHFAKDEVVKKAFGVPVHSRTTTGQHNIKVTARGGETMYPARKNALSSGETGGAAAIPLLDDPSTVSLALDRPTAGSKFPPLEMARTRSIAPSTPLNRSQAGLHDADGDADGDAETASLSSSYAGEGDEDGMDHALGLEVEVSAGRWSVEGQVLKWWYPIPIETSATKTSTSTGDSTLVSPLGTANPNDPFARKKSAASMSSSQKGKRTAGTTSTTTATKPFPRLDEEGKVEYKIRIRRRGGPIDFKKLGVPENWVGLGPRPNSERKTQSTEGSGRTGCCGDGCIIM